MNSSPWSYRKAREWVFAQLHQADAYAACAEQYSWWLLSAATTKTQAQLIAASCTQLSHEEYVWLYGALQRLLQEHEPVQYIIGSVPFLSLTIQVEAPILIPRPETEEWVERLIAELQKNGSAPRSILDLCTGSGCIALALAQAFPHARIVAIDIKESALDLARRNARANGIANVAFVQGDLYEPLPEGLQFDLIVANPPYINPEQWSALESSVRLWEDPVALCATDKGYALIHRIVTQARHYFSRIDESSSHTLPQLWIEVDRTQAGEVSKLFAAHGFFAIQIHDDSFGNQRVVRGTTYAHEPF